MSKVRIDDVDCIAETPKAVLVTIEGDTYWIPKSQIDDDSEVWQTGQSGDLVISEWLAEQKGLAP